MTFVTVHSPAIARQRAHLEVGGVLQLKQIIKSPIDPIEPQVKQVVETFFTPTHTDTLESLLDEPFTSAFDQTTTKW